VQKVQAYWKKKVGAVQVDRIITRLESAYGFRA